MSTKATVLRYLVADALGSVRGVVSSAGSLTASTSYDAWGNLQTTGGLSSYTPIGFAGGYTDPTGLLYQINRYYDPSTGQFVSVDPMVNETDQPYLYAGDDPVNGTDPEGLCLLGGSWCNGIQNAIASSFDSFRHQTASLVDLPPNLILGTGTSIYHAYDSIYQDGANGCSFFSSTTLSAITWALTEDVNAGLMADGGGEVADASLEAAEAGSQAAGAGATDSATGVTISEHGARHLAGTLLSPTDVQSAIDAQVQEQLAGATSSGSFWGRVSVDGIDIEYRAYTLPNGSINVGTYYVAK